MGEQACRLSPSNAVKCIPEFGRILWQRGDPGLMPSVEGFARRCRSTPAPARRTLTLLMSISRQVSERSGRTP